MQAGRTERIRARAYELWERDGCPAGRAEEHWRKAEEEIAEEDGRPELPPGLAETPAEYRPEDEEAPDLQREPEADPLADPRPEIDRDPLHRPVEVAPEAARRRTRGPRAGARPGSGTGSRPTLSGAG